MLGILLIIAAFASACLAACCALGAARGSVVLQAVSANGDRQWLCGQVLRTGVDGLWPLGDDRAEGVAAALARPAPIRRSRLTIT